VEAVAGVGTLVTGAYGMLGSWLVKALLERGERVVVLRRDIVPTSALTLERLEQRCSVVTGDLTAPGLLERAVGEHDISLVFHLAAQTIVPIANRSPLATFESNIRGTWLLLEACRIHSVGRVVVAASDKAYGPQSELPYREDMALEARYPYDVSKAAADMIARAYWHTYRLPVATTRLANIYGGGDLNASRLVPEAISAALAGRAPVIRSDGTPERDFLYVEDAVAAYLALADALADEAGGARGEAFNAGGDRPHSVLEIVELACREAGSSVAPQIGGTGTPAGEIDRQYVDSTKLRALTGWAPRVDLVEGMRRTVAWYRRYPEALP
jgi:CDP-glucose 4,6-dehydratase